MAERGVYSYFSNAERKPLSSSEPRSRLMHADVSIETSKVMDILGYGKELREKRQRNLMASCKLTDAQQRRWISKITDLIDEGPIIIQRLPKMRRAIIAHPETLRWFYMRRLELEILILEEMNRQNRSSNSNLAVNCFDGIFRQEPTRRMFKIVFEILNRMCPDERNLLLLDCSQILFRILS
ncbi:uncharacterized protein LOC127870334 [Dreissena polymorpha]|uniref:uncharacterized protein LOC127870334 n=1 Tax=Dreissena polymorpha TaxID=45954 RepID=UPI0022640B85|nr:uncharacterized protein LOC127870334 [Dreissena polymorpha]